MRFAAELLRILNRMLSFILACILFLSALYAAYALWDNHQIYQKAGNVQADLFAFKPQTAETKDGEKENDRFGELRSINPDIFAWLSMDHTQIDYPVVQGKSNLSYLSTDIYGNYALSGSIFLDSRNHRDLQDPYTVIYGHYMERHRMFGDLALYRDADFFRENREGMLILPERSFRLRTICCFQATESEPLIFDPEYGSQHVTELLAYALMHAESLDEELLLLVSREDGGKLLALTTCSEEASQLRTVLLVRMEEMS